MTNRLIAMRKGLSTRADFVENIIADEEIEDEILDEILDNQNGQEVEQAKNDELHTIDIKRLNAEIDEVKRYTRWARGIGIDTKTRALLKALEIGFENMTEMGAAQKAVVFTESRRTQQYLKDFLEANGHTGRVITFNGTNTDENSTRIYEQWVRANKGVGRVTGSKIIDMRTAIIENFRDHSDILIATEAAAEGINLQFCSTVINFDLPWNPQRIEQRIGRCHRYGQKHDVVVINFLNERNEADRHVYKLLSEKFNLFNGVFGASDEVLGGIESGVDFEWRILKIYQQCRTPVEIEVAFHQLQAELDEKIQALLEDTRRILLEHFDEDVHERLRVNLEGARQQLDRVGKMFWTLTKFILGGYAEFDDNALVFRLLKPPVKTVRRGGYHLVSKNQTTVTGEFLYRISHPLGEYVVQSGKEYPSPVAKVTFDIAAHPSKIALVENQKSYSLSRSLWLQTEDDQRR